MNKRNKVALVAKLARSHNYIVVTDTDATMSLDLGDTDINDVITLAEQRAVLVQFQNKIKSAIRQFDQRIASKKPSKNAKKIPVKQG